jgi:hypothetical protein
MAEEGVVANEVVEQIETPETEVHWSDSFGESATEEIKNFKSAEDFANGYTNLKSKLGDNIKKPDMSTPEGIEAYKEEMGITSIDQYDMPELAEEIDVDTDFIKDVAFRKGIPPNIANEIASELAERDMAATKRKLEEDTAFAGDLEKQLGLKYGAKKDELVTMSENVINSLDMPQEQKQHIKDTFGSDLQAIDMLVSIGKRMSESSLGDNPVSKGAMQPKDAQAKIDEIRNNPEHPFNIEGQGHTEAVKYVEGLYKLKAGEK